MRSARPLSAYKRYAVRRYRLGLLAWDAAPNWCVCLFLPCLQVFNSGGLAHRSNAIEGSSISGGVALPHFAQLLSPLVTRIRSAQKDEAGAGNLVTAATDVVGVEKPAPGQQLLPAAQTKETVAHTPRSAPDTSRTSKQRRMRLRPARAVRKGNRRRAASLKPVAVRGGDRPRTAGEHRQPEHPDGGAQRSQPSRWCSSDS
ncbi:hypothetical protein BDV95DRAFT_652322 [Massariosphaeria phaeospora]|uniref:Uncharacterized protein n=1 Tax=Massariosphaeria phaeospora TaxID=100035 RepID=A0A7C8M043_9PLEO|nr:hypothetical protein BDV95DRAFT_652322 [Massariosphaeria phaeospora]